MSFVYSYTQEQIESIPIPKNVIRNMGKIGLKANEFALYSLIMSYLRVGVDEMPNQKELGSLMGLSERQVKQIISDLKEKGFLSVTRNKGSHYDFSGLLNKANSVHIQKSNTGQQKLF